MVELIERLGADFVSLRSASFKGIKITSWKVEVTFGQFSYIDTSIIGALRKALDEKLIRYTV